MIKKIVFIGIIFLMLCPTALAANETVPLASALGLNYTLKNDTIPQTIPQKDGQQLNENTELEPSDAVANAQAQGNMLTLKYIADDVNDEFGGIRGFIYNVITFNVDPENIPIARDYNNINTNFAVILAVLVIFGESIATSAAASNYPAYSNVFGEKDFSQRRFIGGGISVMAGIGGSYIFRGIMLLIGMIDAYMMLMVMDSIEPNASNVMIYFFLTIAELIVLLFFIYRQVVIVAMYIASPIYGVMWASGYMKDFIDSIGDKVIRVLIMQPLCIFLTVVSIITFKALDMKVMGITVWSGDSEGLFGLALCIMIVATCWWCMFGNFTIVKRTFGLLVKGKVYRR